MKELSLALKFCSRIKTRKNIEIIDFTKALKK